MNDMECKLTQRGFEYYEFTDRYGEKCSLQKSSLATEDAIWMGVDDLGLKGMRYGQGWTPIAEEEVADVFGYQMVQGNKRMHLTRDQVARLLPILQRFVDTGEIGERQAVAGDDLDAMLDSVHPNATASLQFIQPYLTTDPEPYWQAHVSVPTGGLTGFQKHRGTGATRMAAIQDAVRRASAEGERE